MLTNGERASRLCLTRLFFSALSDTDSTTSAQANVQSLFNTKTRACHGAREHGAIRQSSPVNTNTLQQHLTISSSRRSWESMRRQQDSLDGESKGDGS